MKLPNVRHLALMRATREEHERIDLIDVDRAVFVDDGTPQSSRRSPQVLKGFGLVVLIAVAAVIWWPSSDPPEWRVYKPAPVPAAGLTAELIFDRPPGPIVAADLAPAPADIKPEVGYVFGEPDGSFLTRRWAAFRTRASSLPSAPDSAGLASVNGIAANVKRVRVRHDVEWGPVDGRTWLVTTNMLDGSQALEFANQVGFVDGLPALAHRYDLGDMVPIGSVAAFDCVVLLTDLFHGERGRGAAQPSLVTWATLDGPVSLGSIAAPSDALPLVEFVLGAGRPTVVHEQPGVFITSKVLDGPVIAWVEDGRLIMVAGDVTNEKLYALAESVRPASDGEWRVVGRVELREESFNYTFESDLSISIYRYDDPTTGAAFEVNVLPAFTEWLVVCVDSISASGSISGWCDQRSTALPLLVTSDELNGRRFVIAIAGAVNAEGAELRVKIADGTWTLPLEDFGPEVPGLAVAASLPAEYGVIQLWSGGEVVAAI